MELVASSSYHVSKPPSVTEDTSMEEPGAITSYHEYEPPSSSMVDLPMDKTLLTAAKSGDTNILNMIIESKNPEILRGRTSQGNTCLHISLSFGHTEFSQRVWQQVHSLLSTINSKGETPLVVAVKNGDISLVSTLLKEYQSLDLNEMILKQDFKGDTALHYAIRHGHEYLALNLIEMEPNFSKIVNNYYESPMYIAVMRGFDDVFKKLWETDLASPTATGAYGDNALHAAVRNGNKGIIETIMENHPDLAKAENNLGQTPIEYAVYRNQTAAIKPMLEADSSLGYLVNKNQGSNPLLIAAASRGHIDAAQEILMHCPDAPDCNDSGLTILHQAVIDGQEEFVKFIIGNRQLDKLINMRDDSNGYTALHYAVQKCNPKIVRSLLAHKGIDVKIYDHNGTPAFWRLIESTDSTKSSNWNEVFMLMSRADPRAKNFYLSQISKNDRNVKSMKEIMAYTKYMSFGATLIATITFAAPFALPNEIKGRTLACIIFLISDTLAMCSSFSVVFLCILARWEDLDYLIYYRSFTRKLMWFALMTTTVAFATGLCTVVAPQFLWLAILICFLSFPLPYLTYLFSKMIILKLQYPLGSAFRPHLLNIV